MTSRIAIVGAGYGGATLARELQELADVVVIDPRDAFINVAGALRAVTLPDWAENIFFPLSRILPRAAHVRDRAISVDATGVTLTSGARVPADYIVLATGSSYPYPAHPIATSTDAALQEMETTNEALAGARRVLILGAGAVGLELAAEIRDAWPETHITVLEPGAQLLPGYLPEVREALDAQLVQLRIHVQTSTRLVRPPSVAPGTLAAIFVTTETGEHIQADMWFQAYGSALNTDYLADGALVALNARGEVPVNGDLSVGEHRNIYAIGDIIDTAEPKMAAHAGQHAAIVAHNIRTQIAGADRANVEPTHAAAASAAQTYQPLGYPMILLPLGPHGGVGQLPSPDGPVPISSELVAQHKGHDLFTAQFAEQFGFTREQ